MKATVLVVDDDAAIRKALADRFRFWGHRVSEASGGTEALAATGAKVFDLVLLDLSMPDLSGMEVLAELGRRGCEAEKVVLTAHGSVDRAVEAMKAGADDFLTKPADFDLLKRIVERALERRRLSRVEEAMAGDRSRPDRFVAGESAAMRELLEVAERAARSDSTLLITGESGTGKQVLAEFVHRKSPRSAGPFVYVNCVAISDELIESTLFGHERGAFTGAVSRKLGRLEAAAGGTAFLDEVGDVSPQLQAKLLHFMESGEFERVGGNQTVTVDCRLIAATHRDLEKEVAEGRFREDLYFRLNVIHLRVPPLRERPQDIPLLAETFLRRNARDLGRPALGFAPGLLAAMLNYGWPGNVRQLRNAVERMAVLAPRDLLTPDLLPPEVHSPPPAGGGTAPHLPYKEAMLRFREELVRGALARAGGNQSAAARDLGIGRPYLNRLIKELGIRESPKG